MYQLTDYTENQLRIITGVVAKEIDLTKRCIQKAKEYIPEGEILNDVTRKDSEILEVLREFNVHALSALAMVKDQNLIAAN